MKTNPSINLILRSPETENSRRQLTKGVAEVHAEYVLRSVDRLTCSARQKLALLQAVAEVQWERALTGSAFLPSGT